MKLPRFLARRRWGLFLCVAPPALWLLAFLVFP
jgi:hypothetical protein